MMKSKRKSPPHLKVWAGLFDHLENGRMDGNMFAAYLIMCRTCDWPTGIWTGSAERLFALFPELGSVRTAQRVMRCLALGRYITMGNQRGVRGNYPVWINNYIPPCGENQGKKIRPTKTQFWKEVTTPMSDMGGGTPDTGDATCPTPVSSVTDTSGEYSRISSQAPSANPEDQESDSRDQSTNQPIDVAADADAGVDELQNLESSAGGANETPEALDLAAYFPRAQATSDNLRLMQEINDALAAEVHWHNGKQVQIDLAQLLSYNWSHFTDGSRKAGLRLRTMRQAHKAIVHGDPENGVIAQFTTHDAETCRTCQVHAKEEAQREAALEARDPMIVTKPLAGFPGETVTQIVRKPRTKKERQLLLSWRHEKGKRWANIAPWLSQPNCPECRGSGKPCSCIVLEEVL